MSSEQQGERELGVNEHWGMVEPSGWISAELWKNESWAKDHVEKYSPKLTVTRVTLIESSSLAKVREAIFRQLKMMESTYVGPVGPFKWDESFTAPLVEALRILDPSTGERTLEPVNKPQTEEK